MDVFKSEGTKQFPTIILDKDNQHFEISGRSLPENADEFFDPVINWFNLYAQNPAPETKIMFKLIYYNTSSAKKLFDIFDLLNQIYKAGHKVVVEWYYLEIDDDMQNAGSGYAEMVHMPFHLIPYNI